MLSQKPVFVPTAGRRISEATKSRNAGTGVASILNPVNGYRDALARKGVKPKNHHKENLNAIRKKEELNLTAKQDAALEAQKSKFKMSRFANVQAKVTTNRTPTAAADGAAGAGAGAAGAGAPPNGTAYLKRGARADSSAVSAATKQAAAAPGRTDRRKSVSKPAVPTAAELKAIAAPTATPSAVDFVKENSREVLKQSAALGAAKAQAAAAPSAAYKDKADFGRVPDYIIERKLAEAAEADKRRMASKANEGVPPGMVKLSDDERAQTLALLNSKQNDLLLQLSQQPMFVETPSVVKRKFALEQSLKQVEDAIKVFSRKIVYVKAS